jgi:hypothetical protein
MLEAGEQKTITLNIPVKKLARYAAEKQEWQTAAGEYRLWVGSSSREQNPQQTTLLVKPD